MAQTTVAMYELLDAAGVPRGAEIHELEWIENGLRIDYTAPEDAGGDN